MKKERIPSFTCFPVFLLFLQQTGHINIAYLLSFFLLSSFLLFLFCVQRNNATAEFFVAAVKPKKKNSCGSFSPSSNNISGSQFYNIFLHDCELPDVLLFTRLRNKKIGLLQNYNNIYIYYKSLEYKIQQIAQTCFPSF